MLLFLLPSIQFPSLVITNHIRFSISKHFSQMLLMALSISNAPSEKMCLLIFQPKIHSPSPPRQDAAAREIRSLIGVFCFVFRGIRITGVSASSVGSCKVKTKKSVLCKRRCYSSKSCVFGSTWSKSSFHVTGFVVSTATYIIKILFCFFIISF